MKLLNLPPELLLRILEEASPLSCVRCRQVCRLFREFIDEEATSIQYKIELYAAGMVDSPSHHLPIPARLDALRAYQDAWSRLNWTTELHVNFSVTNWALVDYVLAVVDESGTFLVQTIPSTLRGQKPSRQWSFSSGTLTENFGIDPSQDLLIFLTPDTGTDPEPSISVLHICSLTDGAPHPLTGGNLAIDLVYQSHGFYDVQICGSYVAVVVHRVVADMPFRVYCWKTGVSILLPLKDGTHIDDFAFISERYLLLGIKEEIIQEQYLLVWDLHENQPICKLNFSYDVQVLHPRVVFTPECSACVSPTDSFTPSPSNRAFIIEYSGQAIQLLSSTLQKFIQKASTSSESVCLEVEWSSWVSETNVFHDMDAMYRSASGKKFAMLETVDGQPTDTLWMFDFNRRAVLRQQFDDDDPRVVSEGPQDYPNPLEFQIVSSSHLPFRRIQKRLPTQGPFDSFVMNSDAIIVVRMAGFHIFCF